MKSFSERMGLDSGLSIQKGFINDELRNRLWNAIYKYIEDNEDPFRSSSARYRSKEVFFKCIWDLFLKLPVDEMPIEIYGCIEDIKRHFYKFEWNKIYDFIEFLTLIMPEPDSKKFIERCNKILKQENAAYIFFEGKIIEIISEAEIDALKEAISESPDIVVEHIKKATEFYFDRKKPDYKNSIKESISAIEAFARNITGSSKQLSDILKENKFKETLNLPFTLKEVITKLYAYAGDASGVRHSDKENTTNVTKEDARFILMITAATINYIKSR